LTLWYGGVLLAIVLVISAVSYFLLRRTLISGADVELLMVGQTVRDAGIGEARRSEAEVREILGTRFLDVFYRVIGPDGQPRAESGALRGRPLRLSAKARKRGRSGDPTFETVVLSHGERVRLLTIPLTQAPAPEQFIQVGAAFTDIDRALAGYMETLAIMVPMGLGLALVGGAWLAHSALRPVRTISRAARRISAQDPPKFFHHFQSNFKIGRADRRPDRRENILAAGALPKHPYRSRRHARHHTSPARVHCRDDSSI